MFFPVVPVPSPQPAYSTVPGQKAGQGDAECRTKATLSRVLFPSSTIIKSTYQTDGSLMKQQYSWLFLLGLESPFSELNTPLALDK